MDPQGISRQGERITIPATKTAGIHIRRLSVWGTTADLHRATGDGRVRVHHVESFNA